jgi:hypothetical protein
VGDSGSAAAASDTADALGVLRDYYAAIDARDYSRAYRAWDGDGPPGKPSLEKFAEGFATTDSVRLEVGTPGRVEGAAGSRYLSVPVTIRAYEAGGRETTYVGSYALRRSVVEGADEGARRWHLYSATLEKRAADGHPR